MGPRALWEPDHPQPRFLVMKDEKQQEQLPRLFCGAVALAGDTSETHS